MPRRDALTVFLITTAFFAAALGGIGALYVYRGGFSSRPQDVSYHLEEGRRLLGRGAYFEAMEQFNFAIEADPANLPAYLAKADANLFHGYPGRALEDYQRAFEIDPDDSEVLIGLGRAHLGMYSITRSRDHQRAAMSALSRLLRHDPLDKLAHRLHLPTAIALHDVQRSIPLLDDAVDRAPGDPFYIELRSHARHAVGDHDGALADVERALSLGQDRSELLYHRAEILMFLGRSGEALDDLREMQMFSPRSYTLLLRIAWTMWDAGRYDEALELLETIKHTDWTPQDDHFAVGVGYLHAGDHDAAAALLHDTLRAESLRFEYPLFYLWYAEGLLDRRDEAEERIRSRFEANPGAFRPFAREIARFIIGGHDEQALLDAAAGDSDDLSAAEKFCEAWFYIGAVRRLEGDEPGALDAFEQCVQTNVRNYYEFQTSLYELRRAGRADVPEKVSEF